ncbi:hypothetical protein [Halobacillus sp. B29]|uniref:hypothetical protein n=1 Tax=Halobacillus sp. B29 TaxID=3457432 RepID=UPI003FCCEA39
MIKKLFNSLGWLLIAAYFFVWTVFGYKEWLLIAAPSVYLCFYIAEGGLKKPRRSCPEKRRVLTGAFAYLGAIAFTLIFIYTANYIIKENLQLEGWVKTMSSWIAVLLALIPATLLLGYVLEGSQKHGENDEYSSLDEERVKEKAYEWMQLDS